MRYGLFPIAALFAGPAVLSGCALPLPLAIAGYAADGISLAASGKTLTDHALSAAVDEDCAVWRVMTDEDICVETREPTIRVLAANPDGPAVQAAPVQAVVSVPLGTAAPTGSAPAVAVLPVGAPAAAIAAIAAANGYADVQSPDGRSLVSPGAIAAAAPAAGAATAGDQAAARPRSPVPAQLGFAVPLPPLRPSPPAAADGAAAARPFAELPDAGPEMPLPPRLPARRGATADLPAGAMGAPMPQHHPLRVGGVAG